MEVWLNLGCGMRPDGRIKRVRREGVTLINHDRRRHSEHVDVVHDLEVRPWPWEDGMCAGIVAFDVVEHLADTLAFMDEAHRVLRPGGRMFLHTSNALFPEEAWRDPTHRRTFTLESFDFFDPERRWGQEYGCWYTDRYWRVIEASAVEQALQFWLERR